MKAIILAGGMGTRLGEILVDLPKPMAPVGGEPFLAYLLRQLRGWAVREVLLSVGHRKDSITGWLGDGGRFGIQVTYSEERDPLGTGGALKRALLSCGDETFLVMNGDSFFDISFPLLRTFHVERGSLMTLGLASVRDKGRYGSVQVDESGRVLDFQKAGIGGAGWINGGVYLVDRRVVDYIPEGQVSLEGEVMPLLSREGSLYGKGFVGFFFDIGIPEDYRWIDRHPECLVAKNAVLSSWGEGKTQ